MRFSSAAFSPSRLVGFSAIDGDTTNAIQVLNLAEEVVSTLLFGRYSFTISYFDTAASNQRHKSIVENPAG